MIAQTVPALDLCEHAWMVDYSAGETNRGMDPAAAPRVP
jgi:hypothetical protein